MTNWKVRGNWKPNKHNSEDKYRKPRSTWVSYDLHVSYALCIHWHLSVKLLFSTFKIRHCQNVMEDQEHKISSYIEQQEDMKSMVSSLRGCATTSWMNISELLLYFVVIKWVEGRPGSIWHCQLAERYWLLLFCFLPFLFFVSSLLRGAVSFFSGSVRAIHLSQGNFFNSIIH